MAPPVSKENGLNASNSTPLMVSTGAKAPRRSTWRPLLLAAALHCCLTEGADPLTQPAMRAPAPSGSIMTPTASSASQVPPAAHGYVEGGYGKSTSDPLSAHIPAMQHFQPHAAKAPSGLVKGQQPFMADLPPHPECDAVAEACLAPSQPQPSPIHHSQHHQRAHASTGSDGPRHRSSHKGGRAGINARALQPQHTFDGHHNEFQQTQQPFDPAAIHTPGKWFLHLPVTFFNATVAAMVLGLAGVGAVYLWRLWSQKRCQCPMCEGEYVIEEPVGSGGFGTVYAVRHDIDVEEGEQQPRYVLKQITVSEIQEANEAQAEAKELRRLSHKHIVRYVDDFLHAPAQTPGREPPLVVCIVMEYCSYDLRKMIERTRKAKKAIPESLILSYFTQTLEALHYCHNRNIIHRDIKPQNLFITEDGNVRLGDFGLCRQVAQRVASLTSAGTDCYKSPEALLGQRRDGRKADIWALGMVVHELCVLEMAFERRGTLAAKVLKHGRAAIDLYVSEIPENYSPQIRSLIRRMMHADAERRPTADKLLKLKELRAAKSFAKKFEAQQRRKAKASEAAAGSPQDNNGLHPRPRRDSLYSSPTTSASSSDDTSPAGRHLRYLRESTDSDESSSDSKSTLGSVGEPEETKEEESSDKVIFIEVPKAMKTVDGTEHGDGSQRRGSLASTNSSLESEGTEGGWMQVPKRRLNQPQQLKAEPKEWKGKKGKRRQIVFT